MKMYHQGKSSFTKLILTGGILLLVLNSITGCGSNKAASTSQQPAATQGQTARQSAGNPAMEAAIKVIRLQNSQETALTAEQKTKVKPLLQELINASSPTQDFLQQKADSILAIFTDQQNTYLASQKQGNPPPSGNSANSTSPGSNPPTDSRPNGNPPAGASPQNETSNSQSSSSFQPEDIYQQALNSLS